MKKAPFVWAGLSLLGLGLAARYRENLLYYWRLARAQRIARDFRGQCATVTRNVAFSPRHAPRLDIYTPENAHNCPVLVYVYGGSWFTGSKALYAPIAQRLLPAGLVVVIPDYTTYPAGGFPLQTQEIAAAIAWTLDNIGQFGGDPRRVVIGAQSAGGQVASLAVFNPSYLEAHEHHPSELRGYIGISGVYDLHEQIRHERAKRRSGQFVLNVMGGPHNLDAASPITHAGPGAPPCLLIHGDADKTVPLRMSVDLHARLTQAGVDSHLNIYGGSAHSTILFDALANNPARLTDELLEFILRVSAPTAAEPAPQ